MLESEGAASYLVDRQASIFGRRRIGHLRHGQALRGVEYTRREGRPVRDTTKLHRRVNQMINRTVGVNGYPRLRRRNNQSKGSDRGYPRRVCISWWRSRWLILSWGNTIVMKANGFKSMASSLQNEVDVAYVLNKRRMLKTPICHT